MSEHGRSFKKPIVLFTVGAIFCLGPLWGLLGTMLGMTRAFGRMAESTAAEPAALAADVSLAMWAMIVGWLAIPLGTVIVIAAIIWIIRIHASSPAGKAGGNTP